MNRLTEKTPDGAYALKPGEQVSSAVDKLGCLEDMYETLCAELQKITDDIERLKAQGKANTVTHRQLLANKLTCMNLIGRFETYAPLAQNKS